jgi:hypothetical protein
MVGHLFCFLTGEKSQHGGLATLQELSIKKIPNNQWFDLHPQLQQCLFPPRYYSAIQSFKTHCREYFRRRMEQQADLKDLFRRQQRQSLLRPKNCNVFKNVLDWKDALKLGDHIVVYTEQVYHHGIFIGENRVIHVIDETPAINECSLNKFIDMGGYRDTLYGIVNHVIHEGTSEDAFHDATINHAKFCLEHLAATKFRKYDVISNNCECFVWYIITGGAVEGYSEQSKIVSMLILDELKKSKRDGKITVAHALVVGFFLFTISRAATTSSIC